MPFKCSNLENDDSNIKDMLYQAEVNKSCNYSWYYIIIFYTLGEYMNYPQHNYSLSRKKLCPVSGVQ